MRVHVSLPLTGPIAAAGRDVLRGAELARDATVELVLHDGSAEPDRDEQAVANARAAAEDPAAVAYLGDFHSSQVARTAPILGAAELLQVAPVATQVGLGGPTLVRLMPHDGVGARAIAEWLASAGVDDALVVHDHDDDYGVPVGEMCIGALRERGIAVRGRRVWDAEERPADDLETAGAIVYAGVAGSGAVGLWQDLHAARPDAWLIGTEGVAAAFLARGMSASAAARTRFFVANRAPLAFYGFEAMRLILDAAGTAVGDRAAVARAARATRDRRSILGRYALDADGHTTLGYGRLAVVDGSLAWDLPR